MASFGINFNDGDHDKLLEKDGTFSRSEEYSTSDVEISTKSSLSNVRIEKDIKTDEQQRVELFHSTSGLDLQGPYMIHTATFEEVQAYLDQCLQNACWNAETGSFRFRVIYGSTYDISNEDGSNAVLKIQGRCIFFHETFTNSAVAIEKARFYFSNWHIFEQSRDFLPFKSSSGALLHANNGLPALRSNKNYMTVIFLNERPDNARHHVIHGDCIIFSTECLQQLHPIFSGMTYHPGMNDCSYILRPRVEKKTVASQTNHSNMTTENREYRIEERSVCDDLEYYVKSTVTITVKPSYIRIIIRIIVFFILLYLFHCILPLHVD